MTDKCYLCDSIAKHLMEFNYVPICYCEECKKKYNEATRISLREFLNGRGFEEKVSLGGKQIEFVNRNISIHFKPSIRKWRLRDSTHFNDMDITELVFDYTTFQLSEEEKKHINEIILERLK